MKNILFLENSFGNSYGYYQEIISGFSKATEGKCDVYVFRNFSRNKSEYESLKKQIDIFLN